MATGRRRGRAIIYIALILILLLVLVLVFARFNPLANTGKAPAANQPAAVKATPTMGTVEIVITAQDVRRGQELKDDLVALYAIPRTDYVEGDYFTDKQEVIGTRAKIDMKAHTPMKKADVVTPGAAGNIPSFDIPQGKVAISVPMSKLSSLGYSLQKGDHVNVIASLLLVDLDTNFQTHLPNRTGVVVAPGPINQNQTYVTAVERAPSGYDTAAGDVYTYLGRIEIDPTMNNPVYVIPSEPQRPRLVSQTLIQDVVVLQTGTFTEATASTGQAAAGPQPAQPTVQPTAATRTQATQPVVANLPDIVTLIVEPQDAVTLNYLMLSGASLNMVMRSAGDNQVKNTEAVTLQFILDQYRIPNPAKLPYGLEPRIDRIPENIQAFPEPKPRPTATPVP